MLIKRNPLSVQSLPLTYSFRLARAFHPISHQILNFLRLCRFLWEPSRHKAPPASSEVATLVSVPSVESRGRWIPFERLAAAAVIWEASLSHCSEVVALAFWAKRVISEEILCQLSI